jgi:hypothetical protein
MMVLAVYVSTNVSIKKGFTRPLFADLLSEATKVEELLDAYGVKNNKRWYPLRQAVAPIKLFSNVGYILLHVLHFLPNYRLLPIDQDFPAATEKALAYTCSILFKSLKALIREARKLDIKVPGSAPPLENFSDEILDGHLPSDRPNQKVASPEETVVYLATAFLNLAEQSAFLHAVQHQEVENLAGWIPDPISEERLRNLEEMFHNLQSLYDTHISDSNVETLDENLPVLRGHITVIYHLLETATAFSHYCERHIMSFAPEKQKTGSNMIDPNKLLEVLIHYSVAFASRYIARTRSLCHAMLRRYAIQGRITMPAPCYRGFHVRPATLVAKIVSHYGSEVQMEIAGETYNAGVTLDLFRANEKINAGKKRWLAAEVHRLGLHCRPGNSEHPRGKEDKTVDQDDGLMEKLAHSAIQALFSQNKLVLYQRNLPLGEIKSLSDETATEYITRRVLEDIKLLADNGYGEDDFGNNLPLPEKLSYLRR